MSMTDQCKKFKNLKMNFQNIEKKIMILKEIQLYFMKKMNMKKFTDSRSIKYKVKI